jgi:hypothetical protein
LKLLAFFLGVEDGRHVIDVERELDGLLICPLALHGLGRFRLLFGLPLGPLQRFRAFVVEKIVVFG